VANIETALGNDYVAKSQCVEWRGQLVPKAYVRPVVAIGVFLLSLAAIAGDWVDALAKMGWRP